MIKISQLVNPWYNLEFSQKEYRYIKNLYVTNIEQFVLLQKEKFLDGYEHVVVDICKYKIQHYKYEPIKDVGSLNDFCNICDSERPSNAFQFIKKLVDVNVLKVFIPSIGTIKKGKIYYRLDKGKLKDMMIESKHFKADIYPLIEQEFILEPESKVNGMI